MGNLGHKWDPDNEEVGKKLETDNERDLFIVGQTIIERILDDVLQKKIGIPETVLDDPRVSIQLKLDILSGSDELEENLKSNLKATNHLRNMYAHRLEVDPNAVMIDIAKLEYLATTPEEELDGLDKYRICVKQTFDELKKLLEK